jgi:hypothetical protein
MACSTGRDAIWGSAAAVESDGFARLEKVLEDLFPGQ